jgi:hypothetical protein
VALADIELARARRALDAFMQPIVLEKDNSPSGLSISELRVVEAALGTSSSVVRRRRQSQSRIWPQSFRDPNFVARDATGPEFPPMASRIGSRTPTAMAFTVSTSASYYLFELIQAYANSK